MTLKELTLNRLLLFSLILSATALVMHSVTNIPVKELVDGIILSILFILIATITWLRKHEEKEIVKQSPVEIIAQVHQFAEVGKMAFGFMHDVSSAASLVSMNLQELKKIKKNQQLLVAQEILERASVGANRIERYILAARKQINNQQTKEVFSLNDEVKHVLEILDYQAKKLAITLLFSEMSNITLTGNPIKFHQVVTNLLVNAIESYKETSKKDKKIHIQLTQKGKIVILEIRDEGSGINKDDLPHIFTPLFTTKEKLRGSGMGLSMSRDTVIKDFGGTIVVKSQKGEGTSFIVTLPQA